jgi:uncharacterized membrane protein
MPFCSQCGSQVDDSAAYCGKCGARQPGSGLPPRPATDPLGPLSPRTASILCYVPGIGWIVAIVVLASDRFRRDLFVRFHGFQALYLFVAWLMDDWVIRPMMHFGPSLQIHHVIQAILLGMSIFMMTKAANNETYHLPIFGELAQRSLIEN